MEGSISSQESWRSHRTKTGEFYNSLQSCSQVHSDAWSYENTRCKSCRGEWENWRKYRHGSRQKSGTKVRWSPKHGTRAIQFILRHWWISVISIIRRRSQNSKVQRQSCTPRWHCEKWFRIIRSIQWTRIISITNDSRKSHGQYIKVTRLSCTSRRRNILLNPGQNGRCTGVVENSKVRMSRYFDTSTKTQMAQIMVQKRRPSRSSWPESARSSSFGRTIKGKAIWESSIGTRLRTSSELGMFIR